LGHFSGEVVPEVARVPLHEVVELLVQALDLDEGGGEAEEVGVVPLVLADEAGEAIELALPLPLRALPILPAYRISPMALPVSKASWMAPTTSLLVYGSSGVRSAKFCPCSFSPEGRVTTALITAVVSGVILLSKSTSISITNFSIISSFLTTPGNAPPTGGARRSLLTSKVTSPTPSAEHEKPL